MSGYREFGQHQEIFLASRDLPRWNELPQQTAVSSSLPHPSTGWRGAEEQFLLRMPQTRGRKGRAGWEEEGSPDRGDGVAAEAPQPDASLGLACLAHAQSTGTGAPHKGHAIWGAAWADASPALAACPREGSLPCGHRKGLDGQLGSPGSGVTLNLDGVGPALADKRLGRAAAGHAKDTDYTRLGGGAERRPKGVLHPSRTAPYPSPGRTDSIHTGPWPRSVKPKLLLPL